MLLLLVLLVHGVWCHDDGRAAEELLMLCQPAGQVL
jgi:hypothetical protein